MNIWIIVILLIAALIFTLTVVFWVLSNPISNVGVVLGIGGVMILAISILFPLIIRLSR